nr:hypothetical protein [Tanacetum cinerariifolium]
MRTRSSSNLPVVSPSNLSTSNPKPRNRRHSKQPFILEESPIDRMVDQRTMAELLRAPTEGYAEAIVVHPILAEQFELKQSLINMMTTDQFFRLEKENTHDHIRAAHRWLEKEPPHSIHTWEDLVSKFINEFFPPQEQQIFVMKSPIFNNADQDSLNAAAGGNMLEIRTQDVLTIIENKSKIAKLTHAVNQQTSDVTTAMTAILKQIQATLPPASVKAVEEICVTCGGAHPYYQCLAAGGNTFPELWDNIQGYVSAAVVNYNQGNSIYRPPEAIVVPSILAEQFELNHNLINMTTLDQFFRLEKDNPHDHIRWDNIQGYVAAAAVNYNQGNSSYRPSGVANQILPPGSRSLPSNTIANPKGELKAITTRSGIVLNGPSVPIPPPFINPEEDERVEETLMEHDLDEYTIKVPPPLKILKALLSNKEKLLELANTPLNKNCSADILNKLPEKVVKEKQEKDKFRTKPDQIEIKQEVLKSLAMSKSSERKSRKGQNRNKTGQKREAWKSPAIVPLILGRPFLRTARTLIDVHDEEMILRDGDERLTLNMRHDTSSYSNQPQRESINLINVFDNSSEDFLEDLFSNQPSANPTFLSHPELTSPKVKDDIFDSEGGNVLPKKLLDLDFIKDLHPPLHVNPLSGSTIYSSSPNPFLRSSPMSSLLSHFLHDDDLHNLANPADNFVDSMPEMFADEHALDYSSPPIFDEYDDDILEVESETKNAYDDPFDSKGEKIKESKLLIDELDLLCDLPS